MKTTSTPSLFALLALLAASMVAIPCSLPAQSSPITANPDAQPLRKIWEVGGTYLQLMGSAFGSIGDVNGDSINDFGVYSGRYETWKMYLGSRDTLSYTPFWTRFGLSDTPRQPTVGRFWGTRPALALSHYFRDTIGGNATFFYTLEIFRTDSFRLDTVPSLVLDMRKMTPRIWTQPQEVVAYDLDRDGYDELILYFIGIQRDSSIDRHPQVWIYRGGPNFQVDAPTLILRDSEEHSDRGFQMFIGRFDDDPYPDLLYGFRRSDRTSKLAIYFGTIDSPWNWSVPDRELTIGELASLDCNGDSVLDLALPTVDGSTLIFLSGNGKSLRTRSLMPDDADPIFEHGSDPSTLGFISDSARRFSMLDLRNGLLHMGFSGGPPGPDPAYDVYSNELFGRNLTQLLGDITGDGWDDVITGYYGHEGNNGIARIFAGGPYIPRDPSSGVREVRTDERSDAIHIWPNPITTELHIAWRGDLKQMPRGFAVHDISGREVARGVVASWRGEAIWNCTGVPAGTYLLSIYDYTDKLITTTSITKH